MGMHKVKELISYEMEQYIKALGKMMCCMVMGNYSGRMALNIKDLIMRGKNMEKVSFHGRMVRIIKEIGLTIK